MFKKLKVKPKVLLLVTSYWLLVTVLYGCVVRTYPVTKDRVDQDLATGNRGYLTGQGAGEEIKDRKTTRTTQVVEIELRSPIKFEKLPEAKPKKETKPIKKIKEQVDMGNRGYIIQSETPEIAEKESVVVGIRFEKYTVQKGDTLQKISQKFYGTSQKWTKIYEANKEVLKGPDKIYPGQVINIPVETLRETQENLK